MLFEHYRITLQFCSLVFYLIHSITFCSFCCYFKKSSLSMIPHSYVLVDITLLGPIPFPEVVPPCCIRLLDIFATLFLFLHAPCSWSVSLCRRPTVTHSQHNGLFRIFCNLLQHHNSKLPTSLFSVFLAVKDSLARSTIGILGKVTHLLFSTNHINFD